MTIISKKKDRADAFIADLRNRAVYAGEHKRTIEPDVALYGTFALEDSERANMDIYFVHGLGGHALHTWASEVTSSSMPASQVKIWPRDYLPDTFSEAGLAATFSTIGYNSAVAGKNANVNTTIESAAQDFISRLIAARPEGTDLAKKPMYFVCHSLGGLIVSLALIQVLADDKSDFISLDKKYRKHFMNGDECLVKGLVFLGTPFQGSMLASQISPFVRFLNEVNPTPMNPAILNALQTDGIGNLYKISEELNILLNRYNIELLVGYEENAATMGGLGRNPVVSRESAMGAFQNRELAIPLRGDHRSSIKFSERNGTYKHLAELIVQMVVKSLPRSPNPYGGVSTIQAPGSGAISLSSSESDDSPDEQEPKPTRRKGKARAVGPAITINNNAYFVLPDGTRVPKQVNASSDQQASQNGNQRDPPIRPNAPKLPSRGQTDPPSYNSSSNGPPVPTGSTRNKSNPNSDFNYAALREFDTVFLIDDTQSMFCAAADRSHEGYPPYRWEVLRKSLSDVIEVAAYFDEDGVDVSFLISKDLNCKKVKDVGVIQRQLDIVNERGQKDLLGGGTDFQGPLQRIIQPRVIAWRKYVGKMGEADFVEDPPKPLNLIVITDGMADDGTQTENYLARIANMLDELEAPDNYIGIQFVQIGDDQKAREWLNRLDNDRGDSAIAMNSSAQRRDMIDTMPYDHNDHVGNDTEEYAEWLRTKVLFGAVRKEFDRMQAPDPTPQSTQQKPTSPPLRSASGNWLAEMPIASSPHEAPNRWSRR